MLTSVSQRRVVISVLLVALLLGIGAVAVQRTWRPDPVGGIGAGPAATATAKPQRSAATPTPAPTPARSDPPMPGPTGPDQTLTKNSLYTVDLGERSIRCSMRVRRPKPPIADADLAPYLRTVVKCLVKAYREPLAGKGFALETPKVKTYRKTVKTPCGKFGQRGAPAYYCSSRQTIYWPLTGDDGSEAYTFARLGYVGLLAHEFGHHLQATTGMLREYGQRYARADRRSDRNLLSRRLELQAQCFEGVFLAVAERELAVTGDDRYQVRIWHGFTGDEDPPTSRKPDHGSSAAQIRWLERGLNTGDFGRCNTWKASRKSVR
jgi:predicted metalloprotease